MDSSIRVVPYDDAWPERFAEERDRLAEALAGVEVRIEHVGSTAVPGLPAKPIIDVAVGAPSLALLDARVEAMSDAGYHYVPEYESEIPDRRYFRRPDTRPRVAHVHGVVSGGEIWNRHLAFRDWLREYPADRDAYGALKRRLATEHGSDRSAYVEGKGPFIRRVLERALSARGVVSLVVGLTAALAGDPAVAAAQPTSPVATERPTVVGVVVGAQRTEGLWRPDAESEAVAGGLLGVTVEAATPSSWLTVLAEVGFAQRNSNILGTIEGQPLQGGMRTDYLSILLGPRFALPLSPLRMHLTLALGTDQVIRARLDPTLAPVLRESATVFGVGAIAGIGTTLSGRYRVDLEARVHEGLGEAYSGDFLGVRNRTFGVSARVAVPIPESWRPGG